MASRVGAAAFGVAVAAALGAASATMAVGGSSLNFVSLGDWGMPGSDQSKVAAKMAPVVKQVDAHFVLAVGDNFYENGVSSVNDPQWTTTWTNVFPNSSFPMPWYAVLGNHDYHQNPQAEVDYTTTAGKDKRWRMPARWYTENFTVADGGADGGFTVQLVAIDTVNLAGGATLAKLESLLREGKVATEVVEGWRAYMASGRQAADAASQLDWIKATLKASTADWLIMTGHYPIYSAGEHGNTFLLDLEVKPLMAQYKVDAYICGHDHTLQHLQDSATTTQYFVSGNGAKRGEIKTHPSQLKFGVVDPGFMSHVVTRSSLDTTMTDEDGKAIYTYSQKPLRG